MILRNSVLCLICHTEIIACEAECPKTGRVPDYLDFKPFRRTVTSRRKTTEHHHSSEYMFHLINDTIQ